MTGQPCQQCGLTRWAWIRRWLTRRLKELLLPTFGVKLCSACGRRDDGSFMDAVRPRRVRFSPLPTYLETGQELTEASAISVDVAFLGTRSQHKGRFSMDRTEPLAPGDGSIVGVVESNGEGINGLQLRLALNGSLTSSWATTDANGVYVVCVPYGEYRIDGYEFDSRSAHDALPGKTDHWSNDCSSEVFEVTAERSGEGLRFRYVDTVGKLRPRGDVNLSDGLVVNWSPYPGASSYSVHVYGAEFARGYIDPAHSLDSLAYFAQPIFHRQTTEPYVDLLAHGAKLQTGRCYRVELRAYGVPPDFFGPIAISHGVGDFRVVD